ncbi:MAG TPA: hypothetical protein VFE47_23135 [Tepidisphaeraceae bacterium]|jgi:hypothetical protein|nr:hypothetical protein [Tepidisphaeraceae bacterium]
MDGKISHLVRQFLLVGIAGLTLGCSTQRNSPNPANTVAATSIPGLEPARRISALGAWVDPPTGWRLDKHDVDAKHAHFTWLSPSGDTAYGVVLMNLPLPVGPDMVLWGFLNHLRAADKKAEILQEEHAPELQGIRFVADSGLYRIRVNLTVHDWHAWAIYAGTVREKPERPGELLLASEARDHTRVGLDH